MQSVLSSSVTSLINSLSLTVRHGGDSKAVCISPSCQEFLKTQAKRGMQAVSTWARVWSARHTNPEQATPHQVLLTLAAGFGTIRAVDNKISD